MTDTGWQPVRTLADLESLDSDEIMEGYLDGLDNAPEPGDNRTRAYWHGWRNGMVDRGNMKPDGAMGVLAGEFVSRMK